MALYILCYMVENACVKKVERNASSVEKVSYSCNFVFFYQMLGSTWLFARNMLK